MSYGLESKFQNIIDSNFELVNEYNAFESNAPIEYSYEDIVDAFNAYKTVNKGADFSYTFSLHS